MTSATRRRRLLLLPAILALVASTAGAPAASAAKPPPGDGGAVFFAADGLRQDIVARYAGRGGMPTMAEFLKKGTKASGNGMLTQAPPNKALRVSFALL